MAMKADGNENENLPAILNPGTDKNFDAAASKNHFFRRFFEKNHVGLNDFLVWLRMYVPTPAYQDVNSINITHPETTMLNNGIPLYAFNAGTLNMIKIMSLFRAGSLFRSAPLTAFAANSIWIRNVYMK